MKRAHNPKVAGSNRAPATMNDKGLADAKAANPFALPRLHPGSGSSPVFGALGGAAGHSAVLGVDVVLEVGRVKGVTDRL